MGGCGPLWVVRESWWLKWRTSVAGTVANYMVLPTLASVLTTILDYWTWHEEEDADLMRGEMLMLRELSMNNYS